ncbi:alpha/beta hydrolase fold domain-containing protein [Streptomyces sp. NPDC088196]|uniref:prolyl oligopeptidase family serine peptidase n=1 Tax=Streptomyces sp. NPDC088196 TaxID=3154868 RepID=UPI00344B0520
MPEPTTPNPEFIPAGGTPQVDLAFATSVAGSNTSTSIVVDPTGEPQITLGKRKLAERHDIVYATPRDADGNPFPLRLDLLVPDTDEPAPLVLFVPGGGFMIARKELSPETKAYVAEAGFAVASIEYRTIVQGATFREAVADVQSALRHLRAHAEELGVDTRRVALWGESAGAYLAALTGVLGGRSLSDPATTDPATTDPEAADPATTDPEAADPATTDPEAADPATTDPATTAPAITDPEAADPDAAVTAVVDTFGASDLTRIAADFDPATQAAYAGADNIAAMFVNGRTSGKSLADDPEAAAESNPVSHLGSTPALPAFLLLHGIADPVISPSQTLLLHEALRAHGADSTRVVLLGAGHGDLAVLADAEVGQPWSTRRTMDLITDFLHRTLQG